jgi:hypothetical protein
MLREIRFMTVDKQKSHNALFRATYLRMVLDLFADELARRSSALPFRFRSQALNPLLQRQLRGILDHEPRSVVGEVGKTLEDSANFYLFKDPLNPTHIHAMLRNVIYVWPVRLSLIYMHEPCKREPKFDPFAVAIEGTRELIAQRGFVSDEDWEKEEVSAFEVKFIREDKLEVYYGELIPPVSGR